MPKLISSNKDAFVQLMSGRLAMYLGIAGAMCLFLLFDMIYFLSSLSLVSLRNASRPFLRAWALLSD